MGKFLNITYYKKRFLSLNEKNITYYTKRILSLINETNMIYINLLCLQLMVIVLNDHDPNKKIISHHYQYMSYLPNL